MLWDGTDPLDMSRRENAEDFVEEFNDPLALRFMSRSAKRKSYIFLFVDIQLDWVEYVDADYDLRPSKVYNKRMQRKFNLSLHSRHKTIRTELRRKLSQDNVKIVRTKAMSVEFNQSFRIDLFV
jgi:hypothetical protein